MRVHVEKAAVYTGALQWNARSEMKMCRPRGRSRERKRRRKAPNARHPAVGNQVGCVTVRPIFVDMLCIPGGLGVFNCNTITHEVEVVEVREEERMMLLKYKRYKHHDSW